MTTHAKVPGYHKKNVSLLTPSDTAIQQAGWGLRTSFIVSEGPQLGYSFKLTKDVRLVIGSAPDSDVQLKGRGISRKHLCVYWLGDKVYVEDMNSTNGTRINYQKIKDVTELKSGDEIAIGHTTVLKFN